MRGQISVRFTKLTDDETAVVRRSGMPTGWSEARRRQKDLDAGWTIEVARGI